MLKSLALRSIRLYQKYLSPIKGFSCAYRVHTGCASCSAFGYHAIQKHGLFKGLYLLRKRFDKCAFVHATHKVAELARPTRAALPARYRAQAGFADCGGCDIPAVDCPSVDCPSLDCPSLECPSLDCSSGCGNLHLVDAIGDCLGSCAGSSNSCANTGDSCSKPCSSSDIATDRERSRRTQRQERRDSENSEDLDSHGEF